MAYFSNIEDGPSVDGLGCGPECKCGPCKAGASGFGERYMKEKTLDVPPIQAPPKSTSEERLNGWSGPAWRLGDCTRNPNFFAEAPATPRLNPRCASLILTV